MNEWVDCLPGTTLSVLFSQGVLGVGLQIQLRNGGAILLVGDMNAMGGSCDDCPLVRWADEISAYRMTEYYVAP